MRLVSRLQAFSLHAAGSVLALLAAPASVLANGDPRAVRAALREVVGPSIPEPSSIFLFLAGVAVVGWSVHRRRNRSS